MVYSSCLLRKSSMPFLFRHVFVLCLFMNFMTDARLTLEPMSTAAVIGSTVTFSCANELGTCNRFQWSRIASNSQTINILYILDNMIKTYDGRYSVAVSNGQCTLTINGLTMSDAALITCSDFISDQQSYTKNVYLVTLTSLPAIEANVTVDKGVIEGEAVAFTCRAAYNGSMTSMMTWTDSNKQVVSSSDTTQVQSSILTVTAKAPAYPKYQIYYQCDVVFQPPASASSDPNSVLNEIDYSATSQQIPVMSVVSNLQVSSPYTDTGSTIFPAGTPITCSADGYPPPTYKWFQIENGVRTIYTTGQSLFVNVSTDNEFQCVAENSIRGQTYSMTSDLIAVNGTAGTEVSDETSISSTTIGIAIGVALGVAAILVIILVVIYFKVKASKRNKLMKSGPDPDLLPSSFMLSQQEHQQKPPQYNSEVPPMKPARAAKKEEAKIDHHDDGVLYAELKPEVQPHTRPRPAPRPAPRTSQPESEYAAIIRA